MAFDYGPLKDVATDLIADFGKSATLVKLVNSGTDFDPDITESATAITLVETEFSTSQKDGTLIQQGDKKFLISANAATVEQKDRIKLGSDTWQIIEVEPLNPGGTVLIYTAHVRK